MWKRWLAWWRGRPAHRVVVYTRQGCHLCEDARTVLRRAGRRHRLTVTVIDIDHDPDLVREHGEHVPVVAINGTIRFRGRINPILLERLLQAAPEVDRTATPDEPAGPSHVEGG
jgi:glutaredoxin